MLIREAKLLNGSKSQYCALDEAIRTAQFIRNKAVRFWMDNPNVNKTRLYRLSKELASEFNFVANLNSSARQASTERAWSAISNFYRRCQQSEQKKGYPKFQKHCRSVEYKQSGWKLSPDGLTITFTDKCQAGTFSLFCNGEARQDILHSKINRVRIIRKSDGYYCQFCLDVERIEEGNYTGNNIGLDLGLTYFYKDQNDKAVCYPKYLRKSEKRIKQLQRRLSRKFVKGKKPQSNNYHVTRKRLGKAHLKVQRQRRDWAIKLARCVVHTNDVVVYEELQVKNLVKNHHLAKSISDSAWTQFTQWLDYFGKVWGKVVISVNPQYTSQDCSGCGYRVKKTLSTRTHSCPKCGLEICRDTNAALNILKRGLEILGIDWNSTQGHWGTALKKGTLGETTPSADNEQSALVRGVAEPRIAH